MDGDIKVDIPTIIGIPYSAEFTVSSWCQCGPPNLPTKLYTSPAPKPNLFLSSSARLNGQRAGSNPCSLCISLSRTALA